VQTDNGNEFGTDFTWHLRDLGIAHRHIPPGCPRSTARSSAATAPTARNSIAARRSGHPASSPGSSAVGNTNTITAGPTSPSPARPPPSASANSKSPRTLCRQRLD
jgi:hypothetical protein